MRGEGAGYRQRSRLCVDDRRRRPLLGYNSKGQLGDGTKTDRSTPPLVDIMRDVRAIAAGAEHTCAVTNAGGLRCWGSNASGQLGDGTKTDRGGPQPFDVLTGVRDVAAGANHTCAIMTTSGVRCWGLNANGQLGVGTQGLNTDLAAPPAADSIGDVQAIAAGASFTCALTTAGGVRCWGSSVDGALGRAPPIRRQHPPADHRRVGGCQRHRRGAGARLRPHDRGRRALLGRQRFGRGRRRQQHGVGPDAEPDVLTDVLGISTSGTNTCALSNAGGVRCWGIYGVGDDNNNPRRSPPTNEFLTGAREILGGPGSATCVFTTAGAVRCWGSNRYGQLGDGTISGPTEYLPPTAELPQLMGTCP